MDRATLKQRARDILGNKIFGEQWMMMLLVCLVASAISGVFPLVLMGPMNYGLALVFLQSARTGEKVIFEDVFKGFDDVGENILLGLMQSLIVMLWSFLFIIPGIVKAHAYSMSFNIKVDHPDWGWKQCLDESQRMMDGHKWELFVLNLSFIGWILLCILTMGFGSLWLVPYQQMTHTLFYQKLKGEI